MSADDKIFAGSIPENYDRHMVPLIFESYARDMSHKAAALSPKAVLETAAGSGVVTRALAPMLSPDARYVATDLNQPMLDHAAARQGRDGRISWQKADAQALPFEDATFDLVCCQFGVMFFPDRPSAYREARRVLKPGGTFLFNAWDRIEENVFADDVTERAGGIFPERSAALHGAHAARLSRHGADPQRSGEGGLLGRDDRDQGGAKPRAVAASCRGRLLPGHAAAQRDRGPGAESWRRQPTMPHPPSRASMAAARLPPRSRRMSFWRGHRSARRLHRRHCRRISIRKPGSSRPRKPAPSAGPARFRPASWSWRRHAGRLSPWHRRAWRQG